MHCRAKRINITKAVFQLAWCAGLTREGMKLSCTFLVQSLHGTGRMKAFLCWSFLNQTNHTHGTQCETQRESHEAPPRGASTQCCLFMTEDSPELCSRRGWSLGAGHIIFQKKSSLLRELNTHTLFILAEAGNQQVFVVKTGVKWTPKQNQ